MRTSNGMEIASFVAAQSGGSSFSLPSELSLSLLLDSSSSVVAVRASSVRVLRTFSAVAAETNSQCKYRAEVHSTRDGSGLEFVLFNPLSRLKIQKISPE